MAIKQEQARAPRTDLVPLIFFPLLFLVILGALSSTFLISRYSEAENYKYTHVSRTLDSERITPALRGRIKAALADGVLKNWEYDEIVKLEEPPPEQTKWEAINKAMECKE